MTFCTNASTAPTTVYITAPVQIFGTGAVPFLVPPQYRQTTPSRVTFRTNTNTQPFSTRYYASTTPVPRSARRYWRGTKPVVNFHPGYSIIFPKFLEIFCIKKETNIFTYRFGHAIGLILGPELEERHSWKYLISIYIMTLITMYNSLNLKKKFNSIHRIHFAQSCTPNWNVLKY